MDVVTAGIVLGNLCCSLLHTMHAHMRFYVYHIHILNYSRCSPGCHVFMHASAVNSGDGEPENPTIVALRSRAYV